MASSSNTPPTASRQAKSWLTRNRLLFIAIGALIVTNLGIYLYQRSARNSLKSAYEEMVSANKGSMEALAAHQHQRATRLLTDALVWDAGEEMLRGNQAGLEALLNRMAKEEGMEIMVIADEKNEIIIATNKKYEGSNIDEIYPFGSGLVNKASIVEKAPGILMSVAPIRGENRQLGTLYFEMRRDAETERLLGTYRNQPE